MIRVIYQFRVQRRDVEEFRDVWTRVVAAHREAGHASVESVLLDPDGQGDRLVAISRWESRADWEEQRTDEVAPEVYRRFRELCEVEDRQVFDELEALARARARDLDDPIELLADRFDLDEEEAGRLFEVTLWVDQEVATARFGYPRDNAIPAALRRRLLEPEYLRRLYESAADQEPELYEKLRPKRSADEEDSPHPC